MRKFILLFVFLGLVSCCPEVLSTYEFHNVILTITEEETVKNDFKKEIDENILYKWGEEDGELYYPEQPETLYGEIFNSGDEKVVSKEFHPGQNFIYLDFRERYRILLLSDLDVGTKKPDESGHFGFNYDYEPIAQQYVAYGCYKKQLLPVFNPDMHYISEDETWNDISINVIAEIKPISYIYVFQVIIYDDDKSVPMLAESIEYFGLSGISRRFDVNKFKPVDERGVINVFKSKNIQYCDGNGVAAERFITFGIGEKDNYSWSVDRGICEFGLTIKLKDGSIKNGKIDVTQQLLKKPTGGLINIMVKNSDISASTIDEKMDISVEDWKNHEIYVDL